VVIAGSTVMCAGCGAAPVEPYEWVCPNRDCGDDVDHVIVRRLSAPYPAFVASESENPFIRYRGLLRAYHRWTAAGRSDDDFLVLVDTAFGRTPFARHHALDEAVGARVWVKDETGNVAGSHKARHLFGLKLLLRVLSELGGAPPDAPLAIASCGNAALAAATVADRPLEVFVPTDADPAVLARLKDLGATVTACSRDGDEAGDPCYRRFRAAVAGGAIPFGCQGPENGLTIEGGMTLAYEIAEAGVALDHVVVQVGGGGGARALIEGFDDAVQLGVAASAPTFHAVQTAGAAPLARAHQALLASGESVADAARHRSQYMWPWETTPVSIAHGILDDETYDWVAVEGGVLTTGGTVKVVSEALLQEANDLARETTGIPVSPTGSAGLAGLLSLVRDGVIARGAEVGVIFSG
jgi:threonine synthase